MVALVTEEQIIKVLQQYNPWWRRPAQIKDEVKPQKRFVYYEAMRIMQHKTIRRFTVLSGARRVGKTTIMFQMIDALLEKGVSARNILYVSFDNPIVKLVNVEEVLTIYDNLYPTEGTLYLFFDEIQYTNNWELWMKVLYDSRKNVRLTATGSASPVLEKGAADSGTGRWTVLKVPTMSFFEYCALLQLERPVLPDGLRLTQLVQMSKGDLTDLINKFTSLQQHFNRYITIGGFPELVLSDDDLYAQQMLREDVVDKVIKRDVLTLFNVRNPLLMEKLFLYICLTSSDIFNATTASKELDSTSVFTIETYLSALEKSNLIYRSNPLDVGKKGALKGRPKIYVSDAAIRNAVLMIDDVLTNEVEMGIMVETCVYKHLVSFYQGSTARIGYFRKAKNNQKEVDVVIELPREKILCEVKYRNNSFISEADAIVELTKRDDNQVSNAFIVTKKITDFGISGHDTKVPIFKIPAVVFLYLLGKSESEGKKGQL